MGLKMASEEDILASKIFLNRANVRSKAKSWLNTSSGGTEDRSAVSSSGGSNQDIAENDLSTLRASDELSGVGLAPKAGEDDPLNRQLMSANDALRRKLLSKEAYKRYGDNKERGADQSRTTIKRKQMVEDDYEEEEGKGKSVRHVVRNPSENQDSHDNDEGVVQPPIQIQTSSKNRKRPSSYLDQLLADRRGKQQKKVKKSDSND